jgi:hypothetical protein
MGGKIEVKTYILLFRITQQMVGMALEKSIKTKV